MKIRFEDEVLALANSPHFLNSRLLPAVTRRDLLQLYYFVRVTRDYVDQQPARPDHLAEAESLWRQSLTEPTVVNRLTDRSNPNHVIIRAIADLQQRYAFEPAWLEAYFAALQLDLYNRRYQTLADVLEYVYGSAEVLGRCVAAICRVNPDAHRYARLQARAFQQGMFMRDIVEANARGRQYFPQADLQTYGLPDLATKTVYAYPVAYEDFMKLQVQRFRDWQYQAEPGMTFLKRRYRAPLRTTIDLYSWMDEQIEARPFIVYERPLQPDKWRLLRQSIIRLYYA